MSRTIVEMTIKVEVESYACLGTCGTTATAVPHNIISQKSGYPNFTQDRAPDVHYAQSWAPPEGWTSVELGGGKRGHFCPACWKRGGAIAFGEGIRPQVLYLADINSMMPPVTE
jgi:hypothetical protein